MALRKEINAKLRYKRQNLGERMVVTAVGGTIWNTQGQVYVRKLGGLESGGNTIASVPVAVDCMSQVKVDYGRIVIVKTDYEGRKYIDRNDKADIRAAGINQRQFNQLDPSTRYKTLSLITDLNSFPTGGDGTVRVMSGFYRKSDGTYARYAGEQGVDLLTSYTPATSTNQLIACVWIDEDTNTATITASSEVSQNTDLTVASNLDTAMSLINEAAASAPPRAVGSYSYIIKGDDTVISERNKFIDLRPFLDVYNLSGSVGYPSPVTYDFVIPDGNRLIVESGWTINTGASVTIGAGGSLSVVDHNRQLSILSKSADYSMTRNDDVVIVDCSGGNVTITTPDATTAYKQSYRIKIIDVSGGTCTFDGYSSQTIDGAGSKSLSSQYDQFTIVSDGSNWLVF